MQSRRVGVGSRRTLVDCDRREADHRQAPSWTRWWGCRVWGDFLSGGLFSKEQKGVI